MVAAAICAWDPWALLQPGFWLSFVAVGVLFASAPLEPGTPDSPGLSARALALLRAKAEHDHNLDAYRAEARDFLYQLDPLNPINIRNYENAIMRAMGETPK